MLEAGVGGGVEWGCDSRHQRADGFWVGQLLRAQRRRRNPRASLSITPFTRDGGSHSVLLGANGQ